MLTARLAREAERLLETGRTAEAVAAYERLVAAAPDDADAWYNLAVAQRRQRRFEDALRSFQTALDKGVSAPAEVHVNRSVLLAHLERNLQAEAELERALAIDPTMVEALMNLGNLREDRGDREGARAAYERVLAIDPAHGLALARLAGASEMAAVADPIVGRLRQAMGRADLSLADRAALGFALGRALDAAGDYPGAFRAYEDANQANRGSIGRAGVYDAAAVERSIDELIRVFSSPAPPRHSAGGEAPVFICGMFRSGSTLLEQMLGAHSKVRPGGELDLLPSIVRREVQPYPAALANADEAKFARLRAIYVEGLRALNLGPGLLTDKRPDNFLHIGLIKSLFPEARILHTVRDPRDNILSVFFLHLHPGIAYAHRLGDIAHWYRQYRRLMDHWKLLYPHDILDVSYDRVVADPKPVLKHALRFCGLEWEEACLSFHRRDGPVKTASVWQVRQPLYRRSSGRWRNYALLLKRERFKFDKLDDG